MSLFLCSISPPSMAKSPLFPDIHSHPRFICSFSCFSTNPNHLHPSSVSLRSLLDPIAATRVCPEEAATTHLRSNKIDRSLLRISEAFSEDELWAAAWLRVRSFYQFKHSAFGIQENMRYLAEREFEALKERISGAREGFRRVSCINATLPLSQLPNNVDDLCIDCKFSQSGEDRVVVGTLDLNQCVRLPDEISGKKPEGIGADFARAYLSNVCAAKELHRNGLGYAIVAKAKIVAQEWGITDLYVHVAVDNEPAKNLYNKSGFIHECYEPAWQARYLQRPQRILLWAGFPVNYEL